MNINFASDYPDLGYDRKYTFAGILRKYFEIIDPKGNNIGISRFWNGRTVDEYIHYYGDRILPSMKCLFSIEKPLETFTEEDFNAVLNFLRDRFNYADDTMLHLRYLMWIVYKAGFEHGEYEDNIFWDMDNTIDGKTESSEKERIGIMTKVRRSFDINEEIKLLKHFFSMDPCLASGEDLGLLLMFTTGMRNNEVCGLNWSSFHTLEGHKDSCVIDIVQTTVSDTAKIKSGGKTRNAPRVLPLLESVSAILNQRLSFIKSAAEDGSLVFPEGISSWGQLPVVCRGTNYTERCTTGNITKAGRRLFKEIGIEKSQLAVLNSILQSHQCEDVRIDEKEPTAYLFRRNFATHLYHLSFSPAECQYLMGHDIEDPYATRNSFADSDIIYKLWSHIQLLSVIWGLSEEGHRPITRLPRHKINVTNDVISISKDCESGRKRCFLKVNALEPAQEIKLRIKGDCLENIDIVALPETGELSRTVIISAQQKNAYKNHFHS